MTRYDVVLQNTLHQSVRFKLHELKVVYKIIIDFNQIMLFVLLFINYSMMRKICCCCKFKKNILIK